MQKTTTEKQQKPNPTPEVLKIQENLIKQEESVYDGTWFTIPEKCHPFIEIHDVSVSGVTEPVENVNYYSTKLVFETRKGTGLKVEVNINDFNFSTTYMMNEIIRAKANKETFGIRIFHYEPKPKPKASIFRIIGYELKHVWERFKIRKEIKELEKKKHMESK